jgi:hypothetical protein
MEKLDRLGWAAGEAFRVQGLRVGIRASAPDVQALLLGLRPPGARATTSPAVDQLFSLVVGGAGARPGLRRLHLVYQEGALIARTRELEEALRLLEVFLHLYGAERARQRVFVHAGVVGWRGRAILIPGRSLSGKSTLVAAMVKAGAEYYSDEFALLDRHGRVHPYPIPLALRTEGAGRPPVKRTIEMLSGRAGVRPLPVGLVLLTRYEAGALWRPRRLSPGRALLEMLDHALAARYAPERVMDALKSLVMEATVLKGKRGDALLVAPRILYDLPGRSWTAFHSRRRAG